jgi:hypothetical protein
MGLDSHFVFLLEKTADLSLEKVQENEDQKRVEHLYVHGHNMNYDLEMFEFDSNFQLDSRIYLL